MESIILTAFSISEVSIAYKLVVYLLILILFITGILEIALYRNEVPEDNINHIINISADKQFFIVFAWGVIGGHLFLGSSNSIQLPTVISILILTVVTLGFVGYNIYRNKKYKEIGVEPKMPQHLRLTYLILGLLMGHFLWTMNGFINPAL